MNSTLGVDLDALKNQIVTLVNESFKGNYKRIKAEAEAFVQETVITLKAWGEAYQQGILSQADLIWLAQARLDVAKIEGLYQIGKGKIAVDELKDKIISVVLTAVGQIVIPKV